MAQGIVSMAWEPSDLAPGEVLGFPRAMRVPVLIHFERWDSSIGNHFGDPPFMETPTWLLNNPIAFWDRELISTAVKNFSGEKSDGTTNHTDATIAVLQDRR